MDSCVVFGHGYVGKATMMSFGIKKFFTRHEANITMEQAADCKYIFICLPTPTVNGKCFTDDIYALIMQLAAMPNHNDNVFIIRSTVYPGFANHVMKTLNIDNVVSNPEFLSEATWEQDAKQPMMVAIGADSTKYREMVKGLYMGRFKYMQPLLTTNVTAELTKYAMNTFFATKVIFFNEIFDIAQKLGANYEDIKLALTNHPWGTKNHMEVFYKGRRGVHGSCLPKDLWVLAEQSNSPFFKMLMERNSTYV